MMVSARGLAAVAAGLILGVGVFAPPGRTSDADEKELKGMVESIHKIAGSFEKNNADEAKKQSAELAKKFQGAKAALSMEDLMHLFALRSKKGLGVGPKAGAVMPDGLEKKVEALADKGLSPKQLEEEAAGIEHMGYDMAALGEVTRAAAPEKDMGKKKVKDWVKWSEDLRDGSLALADAAKKKNAAGVKAAADRVNTSCNKCHDVFRYDN